MLVQKEGTKNELNYVAFVEQNGRKGVRLQPKTIKKIEAKFIGTLLVHRIEKERIEPRFT